MPQPLSNEDLNELIDMHEQVIHPAGTWQWKELQAFRELKQRREREQKAAMQSVSVPVWTATLRALTKEHRPRAATNLLNDVRACLAEAEMLYRELPPIRSKPKKKG